MKLGDYNASQKAKNNTDIKKKKKKVTQVLASIKSPSCLIQWRVKSSIEVLPAKINSVQNIVQYTHWLQA